MAGEAGLEEAEHGRLGLAVRLRDEIVLPLQFDAQRLALSKPAAQNSSALQGRLACHCLEFSWGHTLSPLFLTRWARGCASS